MGLNYNLLPLIRVPSQKQMTVSRICCSTQRVHCITWMAGSPINCPINTLTIFWQTRCCKVVLAGWPCLHFPLILSHSRNVISCGSNSRNGPSMSLSDFHNNFTWNLTKNQRTETFQNLIVYFPTEELAFLTFGWNKAKVSNSFKRLIFWCSVANPWRILWCLD